MFSLKTLKLLTLLFVSSILLVSCGGKLPGADARKYDPDPKKRVAKNTNWLILRKIMMNSHKT